MTSLPSQDREIVLRHLEELGDAPALSRSPRLLVLLDFLVRETLAGRGHTLKELVIGDALYSNVRPYDPDVDSSVRVEAGRLRRKLDAHYAASHRAPVRIKLPKGSYRPEISVDRETSTAAAPIGAAGREARRQLKGRPVASRAISRIAGSTLLRPGLRCRSMSARRSRI